jgi:hypothetical protein
MESPPPWLAQALVAIPSRAELERELIAWKKFTIKAVTKAIDEKLTALN